MIASERRRAILQALNLRGVVSLRDMAAELGVAEITVRRDMEKLEAEGKLRRVQGGATSLEESDSAELTMKQKLPIHPGEKAAVAAYAAALVREGETVFLDAGTTMVPLAAQLLRRRVNLVTHNTMCLALDRNPVAKLLLVGGEYLPHYQMNVGIIAQETLRKFYFDRAFLSCSGVDLERGVVCGTDMQSIEMKRVALDQAARSCLLLDGSKFSTRGLMGVCETARFEEIVCDAYPGPQELRPAQLTALNERN